MRGGIQPDDQGHWSVASYYEEAVRRARYPAKLARGTGTLSAWRRLPQSGPSIDRHCVERLRMLEANDKLWFTRTMNRARR